MDVYLRIFSFTIFALIILVIHNTAFSTALLSISILIFLIYPDRRMRKGWIPVGILILTTFIGNIFFHNGRVIIEMGALIITDDSLQSALTRAGRVAGLIVAAKILMLTTPIEDIISSLKTLSSPLKRVGIRTDEFFHTATLSIKLLPHIKEEAGHLFRSKTEGLDRIGLFQKMKIGAGILLPLMTRIMLMPERFSPDLKEQPDRIAREYKEHGQSG